tara:strand:+ start:9970 stop:10494 length:525 start_codon:yes stop_codon:yes gene_type:complete
MKKLILILAIALFPLFGSAQSIFSQFEDNDNVTTVVVNKKAFEMMSKINVDDKDAQEMIDLIKGLDKLQVFTTEDAAIGAEMKGVIDGYLKTSKLSELLSVNDKNAKVNIFVKEGRNDNHVTELLMLVNGIKSGGQNTPESVIISITGDIYLDKISSLINGMNISGGEHLKTKN